MPTPTQPHGSSPMGPLSHRDILRIAVPIMISNVSTPLIGVVDTAMVGQIPDAAYIGAAAIGGLIFSFVFWGFGFLRMGTTGLTAQALGRNDIGLILQLILNLTNMALDLLFVLGFGWDVRGVALGTSLAELCAAVIGVSIALRHVRRLGGRWDMARILAPARLRRTFAVNGDIMIRTLALIAAFFWFASRGSQ
jgi:Na+-driven multidrug efflux pump